MIRTSEENNTEFQSPSVLEDQPVTNKCGTMTSQDIPTRSVTQKTK